MRQSIRGYTDGVIEQTADPGQLGQTAAELAAVQDLIAGQDDLRGALVDPGVPAPSRRALLSDILSSRVNDSTLQLVSFATEADRAQEAVTNIQWLAARLDAAAQNLVPVGEAVLGHTAAQERLDGYATAILERISRTQDLQTVEDELFRFSQTVAANEDLGAALSNRALPAANRRRLVQELLAGKATDTTISLAGYATQIGRPRDYQALLSFLADRVAAESNRRLADVRAAVELDASQVEDLATALRRIVGHDVEVRVSVDPSVLAGFVATIGDTVVDASARHRLDLLKERLIMPEATVTTGTRGDAS